MERNLEKITFYIISPLSKNEKKRYVDHKKIFKLATSFCKEKQAPTKENTIRNSQLTQAPE